MCALDYSPDTKRPSVFWTHGKDYVRVKMWASLKLGRKLSWAYFPEVWISEKISYSSCQSLPFIYAGKQSVSKMNVWSLNSFPESWIYPKGIFFLEAMICNNFWRNSPAPFTTAEPSFFLLPLSSSPKDIIFEHSLNRVSQMALFKGNFLYIFLLAGKCAFVAIPFVELVPYMYVKILDRRRQFLTVVGTW